MFECTCFIHYFIIYLNLFNKKYVLLFVNIINERVILSVSLFSSCLWWIAEAGGISLCEQWASWHEKCEACKAGPQQSVGRWQTVWLRFCGGSGVQLPVSCRILAARGRWREQLTLHRTPPHQQTISVCTFKQLKMSWNFGSYIFNERASDVMR